MAGYSDLLPPRRGPAQTRHVGSTPQHTALTGRADMVKNAAGGFVFKTDPWTALRRFLVLGTTSGTYYASKDALSKDALSLVDTLLEQDPTKFVDTVVDVSVSGAALKASPTIFALARAASRVTGDPKRDTNTTDPVTVGRAYALSRAPEVLRTLTHVFEFLEYCRRQRGGGSGLRRALSQALANREVSQVEYQVLKYRNREGWSPRDLLRYAHTKAASPELDNLFAWTVKPESDKGRAAVAASARLAAFEELRAGASASRAAQLIVEHRLSHEMVPNELLSERQVWEALFEGMPLTALTRNLRKMTQVGLLVDGSDAVDALRTKLVNNEALRRARVHPLRLMMADRAYRSGTSRYGHGSDFIPSGAVLGVLEDALEASYSAVEPTGRRLLIAVDNSGSMDSPCTSDGMSAFEAALALAVLYKRTERQCTLLTYTTTAQLINVSNRTTVNELKRSVTRHGMNTDCSAPLAWALANMPKDALPEAVIQVTDNETWAGGRHVVQVLSDLRLRAGRPVANVVCATTATSSSIADAADPHSLDVVGFDPTVPEAISAHVKEVFG